MISLFMRAYFHTDIVSYTDISYLVILQGRMACSFRNSIRSRHACNSYLVYFSGWHNVARRMVTVPSMYARVIRRVIIYLRTCVYIIIYYLCNYIYKGNRIFIIILLMLICSISSTSIITRLLNLNLILILILILYIYISEISVSIQLI